MLVNLEATNLENRSHFHQIYQSIQLCHCMGWPLCTQFAEKGNFGVFELFGTPDLYSEDRTELPTYQCPSLFCLNFLF